MINVHSNSIIMNKSITLIIISFLGLASFLSQAEVNCDIMIDEQDMIGPVVYLPDAPVRPYINKPINDMTDDELWAAYKMGQVHLTIDKLTKHQREVIHAHIRQAMKKPFKKVKNIFNKSSAKEE